MMINNIIDRIKAANNILITTHVSPDGDTTGSALAFAKVFKAMGKYATVAFEKVPKKYAFLIGDTNIIEASKLNIEDYDLAVILDTASADRVCVDFNEISAIDTINIDHHISNRGYGKLNYIEPEAAATGEIIYKFIKEMKFQIDKDIANCIYTAIATDTGCFKYKNTTQVTHQIAADLITYNIDVALLSQVLFDKKSLKEVKLIAASLQNLCIYMNNKVAIIKVRKKMLDELGVTSEECESIVNYARDIDDVTVGIVLREDEEDKIKASMRSNTDLDVAAIAVNFGGGGHKKAAGCTIRMNIEQAQEAILDVLKKLL
jgi:phosphoesterase RecJ-like protein